MGDLIINTVPQPGHQMYPDKYPPGADPDQMLINKENWRALTTPDFTTGEPQTISNNLRVHEELTGLPPLLQISAPTG